MSHESNDKPQKKSRSKLRRILMLAGLPVLAAGLFFIPRALAFGPFHHGRHGHEMRSPEEIQKHMERRAEWALDKLDASDAQRDRIQAFIARAAPQFFELSAQGRKVREEIKDALSASTLDKARIEKARSDLDALADRATDLGMDTLIGVAEVLTPAQRKQVAEHLSRMHH